MNVQSDLIKTKPFYYRDLRLDEMTSEKAENQLHHFFYFSTDNCVIKFENGTERTPSEGTVCYIGPGLAYKIIGAENDTDIVGIAAYGALADAFVYSCNALSTHLSMRPTVIDAFEHTVSLMKEPDMTSESVNRIALAFYSLLIEVVFSASHTIESKPEITAYKIKSYIESNIDSDISVTTIAKQFYLSETHVIRIFKEKYGITPKQYILKCKIDASKLLLLDTSLQIKEIAMTYHFSDSYHFSHTFKRFMGVSPEKYRLREDERKK